MNNHVSRLIYIYEKVASREAQKPEVEDFGPLSFLLHALAAKALIPSPTSQSIVRAANARSGFHVHFPQNSCFLCDIILIVSSTNNNFSLYF